MRPSVLVHRAHQSPSRSAPTYFNRTDSPPANVAATRTNVTTSVSMAQSHRPLQRQGPARVVAPLLGDVPERRRIGGAGVSPAGF